MGAEDENASIGSASQEGQHLALSLKVRCTTGTRGGVEDVQMHVVTLHVVTDAWLQAGVIFRCACRVHRWKAALNQIAFESASSHYEL